MNPNNNQDAERDSNVRSWIWYLSCAVMGVITISALLYFPDRKDVREAGLGSLRETEEQSGHGNAHQQKSTTIRRDLVANVAPRNKLEENAPNVRFLIEALENEELLLRFQQEIDLANFGPAGKYALPELAAAVTNTSLSQSTRWFAVQVIGSLRGEGASAVPALSAVLTDAGANWGLKCQAALALGKIGPGARESIPDLVKLVEDPDWNVRSYGIMALGMIGAQSESAVTAITAALKDERIEVRNQAAEALEKILRTPPN